MTRADIAFRYPFTVGQGSREILKLQSQTREDLEAALSHESAVRS